MYAWRLTIKQTNKEQKAVMQTAFNPQDNEYLTKRPHLQQSDKGSNEKQNFKIGVFKKYRSQNTDFAEPGLPSAY